MCPKLQLLLREGFAAKGSLKLLSVARNVQKNEFVTIGLYLETNKSRRN